MDEEETFDNEDLCVVLNDFKHFDEVVGIIDSLKGAVNDLNAEEVLIEKAKRIFDLYQEQPHLLDPYLQRLLSLCLDIGRYPEKHLPPDNSIRDIIKLRHLAFYILYLLSKTRGYKILVRLLPHEVSDLDPALRLLEAENPNDSEAFETRYILLLWLSIVSLIPFDLARLDVGSSEKEPFMERLLAQGKKYLFCHDGKCHGAAAFFVAHFLSRPDIVRQGLLEATVHWACDTLKQQDFQILESDRRAESMFLLLACLFKYGKRLDLLPFASSPILQTAMKVDLSQVGNILLKKMKCKLLQRLALIHLPPRVAIWRYDRGQRSLVDNLSLRQSEFDAPHVCNGDTVDTASEISPPLINSGENEAEEDFVEIPDDVSEVIDYLLNSLREKNSFVRWSAAKGIGRICNRLAKGQVDEVIEAILQLFSRLETHAAWHGACLALAELSRRGLLLPHRMSQVMPLVLHSLFYDEQSGDCGLGANVRDAACYVCWSFARAYGPKELAPIMQTLSECLILVTLFDREVNVRRAAAAAFQEHVGRQGKFTHGIDILTTCDYFSVGRRQQAYLQLSVCVAQFEEYRIPMIDHLVQYKLGHWDTKIRELAAKALHELAPFAKEYVLEKVLPSVMKSVTGFDVLLRHGALMGVAEIIYAFNTHTYDEEMLSKAKEVIIKLQEMNQFRGVMGEDMRQAMCLFIKRVSQVQLPFRDDPIIRVWRTFLFDCMQQNNVRDQEAATTALGPFVSAYIYHKDGSVDVELKACMQEGLWQPIGETNYEWVQSGCVRGIGESPQIMWSEGHINVALSKILFCCSHTADPRTEKWGDARVEALTSLTRFLKNIGVVNEELVSEQVYLDIISTLLLALEDYTVSNRGDIGSRVRGASMQKLSVIIPMLLEHNITKPFTTECCTEIIGRIIQQSVEKIDKTRQVACETLFKLLHHEPPVPNIPHYKELLEHFTKEVCESKMWSSASESYPVFTRLLNLDAYRIFLLQGLIVSIGGLTETTALHSSESLMTELQNNSENEHFLRCVVDDTLAIFTRFQRIDRVSIPLLKFLDFILHDSVITNFLSNDLDKPLQILEMTKREILRSKDVHKIKAAIDVYCGLLQFPGEICSKTLFLLAVLLGHQYPVVRKNTANKLYEATLVNDFVDEDKLEKLTELLTETIWENPLSEVRAVRNNICDVLGIAKPVVLGTGK